MKEPAVTSLKQESMQEPGVDVISQWAEANERARSDVIGAVANQEGPWDGGWWWKREKGPRPLPSANQWANVPEMYTLATTTAI